MRAMAYWLSLLLIFTMPWDTAIETSDFGSLSRMLGLLVAACWIGTVVVTREIRRPHLFHMVFFLFVCWHLLSVLWTVDSTKTLGRLGTYVELFVLMYIVWDLFLTPNSIKGGLQAYVWGAWITVAGMAYNFLSDVRFTSIRYSAFGFDENNVGVILALGIPIAWYLGTVRSPNRLVNALNKTNVLYVPAALFAILLTGSRGSVLAALPGIAYVLASSGRLRFSTRVVVWVLLGAIGVILLPYVPDALLDRVSTTGSEISEGDLNGRVGIWIAGFNAFAQHPFLGVGSSAFTSSTSLEKAAHNSYLVVLFELGVIGFSLLLLLMIVTAYYVFVHPKESRYFWIALLSVLALGIFSLNWAHRKQNWIFPILAITSAYVQVNQVRTQRTSRSRVDTARANSKSSAQKV